MESRVQIDFDDTGEEVAYFRMPNGFTISVSGIPVIDRPGEITREAYALALSHGVRVKVRTARAILEMLDGSDIPTWS
jgi:hypothetical protein